MSSSCAGSGLPTSNSGSPATKRIRVRHDEDIGRPIEDEATAKRKLKEAGFNLDKVSEPVMGRNLHDFPEVDEVYYTPMIYFSYKGDLPMCRYLYDRGAKADVTKSCSTGLFPMWAALAFNRISVCQWLCDHGEDVRRPKGSRSPLKLSLHWKYEELSKWLILNGALHRRPTGTFDADEAEDCFSSHLPSSLKSWALDTVACHAAFHMFLLGALPLPDNCTKAISSILSRDLRSEKAASFIIERTPPEERIILLRELSPLHILSGFPEILENIADFVGVLKRRSERDRLRDLADFVAKHPTEEELQS